MTVLAAQTTDWLALGVKVVAIGALVPTAALVLGYSFLKMLAHMQSRLGPMEAGPHGTLQLFADGLKFMQKEDVIPDAADRTAFAMAPAFALVSVVLVFITVPFGPQLGVINIDSQVFMTVAVQSIGAVGVLLAGWASANKFSMIGGFRAAAQLIAYELPLLLSVLAVVMLAGSMNPLQIIATQASWGIGDALSIPFIIPAFVAFVIFIIAGQAELSQAPFDLPFAESELTSGFATEYTGFRYLFFFVSEFAANFALAALGAVLFLGGYAIPFVPFDVLPTTSPIYNVIGPFVMAVKIALLVFLFFWMRSTFPRLREDQIQTFAWKYMIPVSLANIVVIGLVKVVF